MSRGNSMRPGDFQRYIARVSGGSQGPSGNRGEAAKDALRASFEKYEQERQERQWRATRTKEQDRIELQEIWELAGAQIASEGSADDNEEGEA